MVTGQTSWHLETAENVWEAAYGGNARAQTVLGFRHQFGIEGLPEDHVIAAMWYRRAAESGLMVAQACLAEMYKDGLGVSRDSAEAAKWQVKAGGGYTLYNSRNAYFEMLLWSTDIGDAGSFQKLVKLFDSLKRRNNAERSLSSVEKDHVLGMCFSRACSRGLTDMAKAVFLEANGLDINQMYPPLVWAAETGNFELAEFCLRVGADPLRYDTGNDNVKTPLEIARKNGHTKLAQLLEQAEKKRFFGRAKSMIFRKLSGGGWI